MRERRYLRSNTRPLGSKSNKFFLIKQRAAKKPAASSELRASSSLQRAVNTKARYRHSNQSFGKLQIPTHAKINSSTSVKNIKQPSRTSAGNRSSRKSTITIDSDDEDTYYIFGSASHEQDLLNYAENKLQPFAQNTKLKDGRTSRLRTTERTPSVSAFRSTSNQRIEPLAIVCSSFEHKLMGPPAVPPFGVKNSVRPGMSAF